MKIVFLTQYYPPETGAAQRRLSGLAARMVVRGHDVTVLTAMPSYPRGKIYPGYGGTVQREEIDGVKIIHTLIYPTQKADYVRRLTNYFSFMVSSSIVGALLLERPDYLIVESPPLFLGLTGFALSRLKRARMIFNVSDLWPESAVSLGILKRESLAYRLSQKLEEFCYRHAWLVTGQARGILDDISRRYPEVPTYFLSNGVDTARYDVHPGKAGGKGDCNVLYAGLHGLAQGLDQVVDAAAIVRESGGCRFLLIGDGPEKEALRDRALSLKLPNITFGDSLPSGEVPALVSSADIVLVTLKLYIPGAVPSKLYEAMAASRPVVLVADGEAADIVRTHRAGLVVKPGDTRELARSICLLRDQPELRREMGANGRRAAVEFFDSARIADHYIDHLEECRRP